MNQVVKNMLPRITPHVLTVLVTRAEELPGLWVSHCLNLDVISQGETIPKAVEALKEAVLMVMNEDESEGLDPFDRERAPEECWHLLGQIMREGVPVDSVEDERTIEAVVTQFRVLRVEQTQLEQVPEPWQVAAIRGSSDIRCSRS